MTYIINKTNDNKLVELEDEVIDTETLSGIGLIGRLTPSYGETQSNNFVHLAENFANTDFPKNPLVGQLCYKIDKNNNKGFLHVCIDNNADGDKRWKKLPNIEVSNTQPASAINGDMWYDINNHAFKIYDNSVEEPYWITIGPDNYNDTKSILKEAIVNYENPTGKTVINLYDFNNDLNNLNEIGYLITLSILGKEVKHIDENNQYGNDPFSENGFKISGWKIQTVVNCYKKSVSENVYEFVDHPDYELIGTNDSNWNVKLVFGSDGNEKSKLKLEIISKSINNDVKWKIKMDMLKVS